MKRSVIRYSMIILLIGLIALTAVKAYAQGSQRHNENELLSHSWGLSSGQAARVSVVNFAFADGSVRAFTARIQLLDTEGEVIAQSDEMEVAPGKIRSWDVPREQLPTGDPTGRIQVRTRVLVTTRPIDLNSDRPPLALTMELIDPVTGRTNVVYTYAFLLRRSR